MLFKPACKIGAFVMLLWSAVMLVPLSVAWQNWQQTSTFLYSAGCCALLALILYLGGRGAISRIQPRALFMATAFNWLLLSFPGTLPFLFAGIGISFTDSLYESVSGITTTGGSIFADVESLPRGILLWRSLSQWIGGIGIILVAVAVLPSLKIGGMKLFRSEFSEWSQLESGRISRIALIIGSFYLMISGLCCGAYLLFGMSGFDAVNHTMTTVSTAGFSTWNDSFGHYDNSHLHLVASIFMLLGASPILIIMLSITSRSLMIFQDRQVQHLLLMTLAAALLIALWRSHNSGEGVLQLLESSFFNVVSIATTTGYASADYGTWGSFALMIMCFLMFSGGASGSTSGGIKLFRYHLLYIFMKEHIHSSLHPQAQISRQYNKRTISDDILVASLAYFFFVIVALVVSSSLLALMGLDPITSFSGSLTTLMNVGPGLGPIIGPTGNFGDLPDAAKYILSINMLLGRLEYLTLVIIFTRAFWKW